MVLYEHTPADIFTKVAYLGGKTYATHYFSKINLELGFFFTIILLDINVSYFTIVPLN